MPTQPTNATQVILRDGRALRGPQRVPRVDVQLYPTRYTRSGTSVAAKTQPDDVFGADLVHWYRDGWTGTEAVDLVNSANNMTAASGRAPTAGAVNGHVTADFPGVDEVIACSDVSTIAGATEITIFGAFKLSAGQNPYGCIIGKLYGGVEIFVGANATGDRLIACVGANFDVDAATSDADPFDDTWHRFVYTWNNVTGGVLYLDGVAQTITEPAGQGAVPDASEFLSMGGVTSDNSSAFDYFANGETTNVGIAIREANSTEIIDLDAYLYGWIATTVDAYTVPSTAIDVVVGPSETRWVDVVLFAGLEDPPPPVPEVVPDWFGLGLFQDQVVWRSVPAAHHRPHFMDTEPVAAAFATVLASVYPDWAARPMRAQPDVTARPLAERRVAFAGDEVFPDGVAPVRALAAPCHQATPSLPLPDPRTAQWTDSVEPERVWPKQGMAPWLHQVLAEHPSPERKAPFADSIQPERVWPVRALATSSQQATAQHPTLDRQALAPFVQVVAQDKIDRVVFGAHQQRWLAQHLTDRRQAYDGPEVFPDYVFRWQPHGSRAPFTVLPVFPDPRTTPYADAFSPATVDRRSLPASAQQALAWSSLPERQSVFVGEVTFPAALDRVLMAPARQLAFAAPVFPPPAPVVVPDFYAAEVADWLPRLRAQPTPPVVTPPQAPAYAPTFYAAVWPTLLPAVRVTQATQAPPLPYQPPAAPVVTFFEAEGPPPWLPRARALPTQAVAPPPQSPVFAPFFFAATAPAWLSVIRTPFAGPVLPPPQTAPAAPTFAQAGFELPARLTTPRQVAGVASGIVAQERALVATEGWAPVRVPGPKPLLQVGGVAPASAFPRVPPVALALGPDRIARAVTLASTPGFFVLARRERTTAMASVAFADGVRRERLHPTVISGQAATAPYQPPPPTPTERLVEAVYGEPYVWDYRRSPWPPWMGVVEFDGPLGTGEPATQVRQLATNGLRELHAVAQVRVLTGEGRLRLVVSVVPQVDEEE